jgi:hypothetical protein
MARRPDLDRGTLAFDGSSYLVIRPVAASIHRASF